MKPLLLPSGDKVFQSEYGLGVSADTAALLSIITKHYQAYMSNILELGCASGILCFCMEQAFPQARICGIDIQADLIKIAQHNKNLHDFNSHFLEADICTYHASPVNLIVANPPYYPLASGRISPVRTKALATHELACTIDDVISCIVCNLDTNGRALVIYPSERTQDFYNSSLTQGLVINHEYSPFKNRRVFEVQHASN